MLFPKTVVDVMCVFSSILVMCNVDLLIRVTGMAIFTGLIHEPLWLAFSLVSLATFTGGSVDGVGVHTHLVVMLSTIEGSTLNTLANSADCFISSFANSLSSVGSVSEVEGE